MEKESKNMNAKEMKLKEISQLLKESGISRFVKIFCLVVFC